MINRNALAGKIVAAGFTQREIAKALGMSRNTFSAKMRGKTQFDVAQAEKICEILGIHLDSEKVSLFFDKSSQ